MSCERSSRRVSRIVRSSGSAWFASSRSKNRAIVAILAEGGSDPATGPRARRLHDILGGTMRTILLWMAGNRWLRNRLPKLWFARRAVRRFMPGEEAESALVAATQFRDQGIASMFTRLGENVTRTDEGDAVAEHYLGLLDTIAERGLDGEISVKLTQLGFDLDEERTLRHVERLAERAAQTGRTVWVDMEGERLRRGHDRLLRAPKAEPSEHRAVPPGVSPPDRRRHPAAPAARSRRSGWSRAPTRSRRPIAYQRRQEVDANYVALAVSMLEAIRAGRTVRIGLGTHDVRLIEQIAEHAARSGSERRLRGPDALRDPVGRAAPARDEGYRVRDLIAYGDAWYPWYMRRLAERPANVLFALRQLLP